MGIRSRYRSFKEDLDKSLTSPDCQNCGDSLHREKIQLKPMPKEFSDKIYSYMLASLVTLGVGAVTLVSAISLNVYYGSGFDALGLSGLIMAGLGFAGLFLGLPITEYYAGRIANQRLKQHPLCYECMRDENARLWSDSEETHFDYVKDADVEYDGR